MKRKPNRTSKKTAIRIALAQLGWHATGRDVVAYLANFGIEVNEGLVSKVKMENLQRDAKATRHEQKVNSADSHRKQTTIRKIPQRREYRK